MTASTSKLSVRPAGPEELPTLHGLAARAVTLDRFSPELLAEKLFRIPRPERQAARVYLAESSGRPVGLMHTLWDTAVHKGWIGIFAVEESFRRQGVATALLARVQADWAAAGVTESEVLAMPGNYFNPGLDPRYTAALSFLERMGYERFKDCVNMLAPLDGPLETQSDERRLAQAGVEVRRAARTDEPLLDRYFAEHFGPDWRLEAQLAMDNDPPALHLGLRDGRMLAFSAHSTQNREWGFFGPMGTIPETRGLGIGRVLLRLCLNDLYAAGHRTAVIPWVGPIAFYSYHANCRVERVFWRYRKVAAGAGI